MSREQYQQETQQSNDLFEEYLENLPEPDVQISSQVEQDVRQMDNEAKEKKKSRKLRVAGYIAAAVLALGLNLFLGYIAEANKPQPEPPVVVVDNPHYSLIMLDMLKNMEKDVSSDTTAGTSLKNAEIQIHGRTYHLPNSLMMFLQNGWAVENTEYLETKDGFTTVRYTLVYLDRSTHITVMALKPVDQEQLAYTVVTDVIDTSGTLELPGGISTGTSEDDLISILNGSDVEWQTTGTLEDGTQTYTFDASQDNQYFRNYHVEIQVNGGRVINIITSVTPG